MHQREAPSVLKALLQEISENYLGVAPIRSGDSVIIDERSVLPFGFGAGKQGGTALTRPMHYRNVVCGYFYAHGHPEENLI